jgi:hypothetical protein
MKTLKRFPRVAIPLLCAMFFGPAFAQDSPDLVVRGTKQFRKRVLVSGLGGPREVTWGPDKMLSAPASLADQTYADIVAYILDVNSFRAGQSPLPSGGAALDGMTIR